MLGALPAVAVAQQDAGREQTAAGEAWISAGKAAYAERRFAEALFDFEQAYQRLPRASLLYRIGDTADKVDQHERAVTAFREYLEAVPNASERVFIETRIEANLRAMRAPSGSRALSPRAAARAGATAEAQAPSAPAAPPRASSDVPAEHSGRAWWLWAGVGTLAVTGIVLAAVLVGSSSTHMLKPVEGNVGGVVRTLGGP
jgi:tetratricopeptide (TPR) repeat protein